MKQEPLVIERTYSVPIEKVWKAITSKEQMKEWYFTLDSFEPEVGFEFEFEAGEADRKYRHICKITDVEFQKSLGIAGAMMELKETPM